MSDEQPSNLPMTQEQIEEEAAYNAMSGKQGLEVFTAQLREAGIGLAPRDVFKYINRKQAEASMHAAFRLMGGVPGLVYWASQNPTEFYTTFMKTANADSTLTGGGGVTIQLPDFARSPLDAVTLDKDGFVVNTTIVSKHESDD